jgi:hypothetical protein
MTKEPIFYHYERDNIYFNNKLKLYVEGNAISSSEVKFYNEIEAYPLICELVETNSKAIALLNLNTTKYKIYKNRVRFMCKEILFNDNKFIINYEI